MANDHWKHLYDVTSLWPYDCDPIQVTFVKQQGILLKHSCDSAGLRWVLKTCVSQKLLGDADVASHRPHSKNSQPRSRWKHQGPLGVGSSTLAFPLNCLLHSVFLVEDHWVKLR